MGLFDGILGAGQQSINIQQAIMIVIISAIEADGDIADEEIARLKAMCMLSPIFASNSSDQDLMVIRFASDKNTRLGSESLSVAASNLSLELRETAFAFACDMILADGVIGSTEEAFLEKAVSQLEIDLEIAKSIVNVTLIRNRH
jgi:uncharacterized tellurite resistance protein B-like protein